MQNEGHIQPSLRSAYDFLSKGFPQGKAPVDTWLELVVHRSALALQNSCSLHPLFGLITLMTLWEAFTSTLSVTYEAAVIFLGDSALSQICFPKIQQGANDSQYLFWIYNYIS